jgi:diaminohydroxyphosphoribosylaminopyrimidine deaminase/5-amino-6-(5-phosphoribosylamino)uracil reductase
MDAIMVGIGTALTDDPLLTARLSAGSRLVKTAREVPLLVAVGPDAATDRVAALEAEGCEVWQGSEPDRHSRLVALLRYLGARHLTNLLVEGGAGILGSLHDGGLIDEVWAFVAPKLLGGDGAPAAIGGLGSTVVDGAPRLVVEDVATIGEDILIRGLVTPADA